MHNTNKKAANFFSVTVAIVAVVALSTSVYTLIRLQSYDVASMDQQSDIHAQILRIRFCHDKQIFPCDDVTIQKWNAEHTDDRFN